MGKFEIPRIVKTIRLRERAEEYGEARVVVWVNPPRGVRLEHDRLQEEIKDELRRLKDAQSATMEEGEMEEIRGRIEAAAGGLFRWWAELWSQGAEAETHWTVEEVRELVRRAGETDPGLYRWLQERSFELMREWLAGEKKS